MTDPRERITVDDLAKLRGDYDVVPLVRELSADTITPVAAFEAVSSLSDEAFLFESVERGEAVGRYSFIGYAPRKRIVFDPGSSEAVEILRSELRPLRAHRQESLPPFFGGAVGFFGYGAARWSERLPDAHQATRLLPDAVLLFFDNIIVFDHVRQRLLLVANVFTADSADDRELIRRAEERLGEAEARLRSANITLLSFPVAAATPAFEASVTRDEFTRAVRRAKEEIAAGEIYQIVLSQRWTASYPTSGALPLYRALRSINPSPYMFLLRTRECTLVGASPEMLVRESNGRAELRPIAGTRPRGGDRAEDDRLENELLADPKENAEHLMLVDLGRNDLGRVCSSGSVRVTEFAAVERYSHVMHIVSSVEGMLREGLTPIDLFLAAFPAGTVSGAPKLRAMELIDEIEPVRRDAYAGAVAYVGFAGSLDSCITIRTIVLENDRAHVQAGAGIVFDSDPDREYEETVSKAAALRQAIGLALALHAEGVARPRHETVPAGAEVGR
ncbi:MAG TPA: chorismate-binding protein [Thermoanaerobaculia bacterium]|nr:chorismate-binding protein [Thermoanaerobaculia bacterium]